MEGLVDYFQDFNWVIKIFFVSVKLPAPLKNRDFVTQRSWCCKDNEFTIFNHSVHHKVCSLWNSVQRSKGEREEGEREKSFIFRFFSHLISLTFYPAGGTSKERFCPWLISSKWVHWKEEQWWLCVDMCHTSWYERLEILFGGSFALSKRKFIDGIKRIIDSWTRFYRISAAVFSLLSEFVPSDSQWSLCMFQMSQTPLHWYSIKRVVSHIMCSCQLKPWPPILRQGGEMWVMAI